MKYDEHGNWIEPKNDREAVNRIRNGALIIAVVVVAVGLISYFAVFATADKRGKVALHNQTRSPEEQRFNYEYFHNTCRSVITDTQQVKTLQAQVDDLKANPPANDPFGQAQSQLIQLETQLTGLKNSRDDHAQEYNAKSHEFTRNFIKSKDLPDEIGPPTGVSYDALRCEG